MDQPKQARADRSRRIGAAFALLVAAVFALLGGAGGARAQTATAVEYYYAGWDHYFVTANAGEVAALDGGALGGVWHRTGQTFTVSTLPAAGLSETCRFFSTAFAPKSSHFYTPFPSECALRKADASWQYEAIVFYLQLPDASGACPAGTVALYRLFNNGAGGAPNHRYTTSATTVGQMHAQGWTSEGGGPDTIFACVPPGGGGAATAAGIWTGTTSLNEAVRAIILPDGTYYIVYSRIGDAANDGGVFQGTATMTGGAFASSDGVNFARTANHFGTAVTVAGSYVAQNALQLSITDAQSARTLTAAFVPGSDQTGSLAPVAGSYAGITTHAGGVHFGVSTFFVNSTGIMNGDNPNCDFSGPLTPHPSVNAFDLSITALTGCPFEGTLSGILYYDDATRQIRGFAPFSSRADLFFISGTKP